MSFGGLGGAGVQVRNQEGQNVEKGKSAHLFLEVVLGLFRHYLECVFLCIFRCARFPHFGRFGDPKVPKRDVSGGHFEAISGVGSTCENRCFMYTGARF